MLYHKNEWKNDEWRIWQLVKDVSLESIKDWKIYLNGYAVILRNSEVLEYSK